MPLPDPTATDLPGAMPGAIPPAYTAPAGGTVYQESGASAVSWGAIFAGAAGAAALSLILLLLGTGLGLSSASPWASRGASAGALGVAGIAWIIFTQLAASGLGGYLAGRLRTRWAGVHTDEVYFRDTAHGFLAWGIATLVTAAFLASAVGSIVGMGAKAGAAVAGGAAGMAGAGAAAMAARPGPGTAPGMGAGSGGNESTGYFVDSLFRIDAPVNAAAAAAPAQAPGPEGAAAPMPGAPVAPAAGGMGAMPPAAATSAEVSRIMANGLRTGSLPQDDQRYAARLVAQRTGISQQDAEKRVADTFAKAQARINDAENAAREAADQARAASAHAALWLFISLLVGAFIASLAATFGGRQRDL